MIMKAFILVCLPAQGDVTFEKRVLSDLYFCDGIHAGDVNRDGKTDVVAGPYWYEGPSFTAKHEIYPAVPHKPEPSPSDSMFSYVHDLNGDGWPDLLRLGRVHKHEAAWFENPRGKPGLWKRHFVFERVRGESPPFTDVDGDGKPEIVCHWEDQWGWIRPDPADPTKPWSFHPVTARGKYKQFYHGTGVGDVNGDGRSDLILNEGWWEQPPAGSAQKEWTAHPFRFGEKGGAQMFAVDVDGDGDRDVITSLDGHGWGLAWFEQTKGGAFKRHVFMGDRSEEAKYGVAFSQVHAIDLADIDGDGLPDVVTGKRRWAHGPKGDVEPNAAPVIYWFRLERNKDGARFVPHLVDDASGVGVQVTAKDVTGDGAPDILAASKLGTFLFVTKRGR